MNVRLQRTLRSSKDRDDMHKAIAALQDTDHAVLVVAHRDEDENDDREIDVEFMNVSLWQVEGMLRTALRFSFETSESLEEEDE